MDVHIRFHLPRAHSRTKTIALADKNATLNTSEIKNCFAAQFLPSADTSRPMKLAERDDVGG
jgi:hypothetical protein